MVCGVVCFDTFDGFDRDLDFTLTIHGVARFGEWHLRCLLRLKGKSAHVEPIPNASYAITMNVYDEAMSEEKRNAHRGVIQQLNRSVTRSAPKQAIPQIVDKVGVPDGI